MMRRFVSTGAKAVASATVSRRGFQSLKAIVPKSAVRTAPTFRFNSSLTEVLGVEIDEEKSNDDELDQDLIDVRKQILKVFKIKEEPGVSVVTLSRKHGDEKIEVKFNVQDFNEGDGMIEEAEEGDEENDPENEDGSNGGIDFEVTIHKGNSKVIIDAMASESLNINNIRYIDAAHATTDEMTLYTGPNFEDLEESVQAAFYEYLTERNIDDDLSFFILAHSREKEQKEYINWLEKMQDFTAGAEK
eukprot:CAMPEP_0184967646 /NCGR_PEP_ID=MMETSP1098-20130426/942_1 /TAXON_ID=89044 /ORGANISM="Spumella elongata, Strain CCAP 955/1" /LENGTH=245 /DNA_ID=CAMNT_0027489127 /DNA_START=42 /DNA_END=779 /DNA_ORIENTATION=+